MGHCEHIYTTPAAITDDTGMPSPVGSTPAFTRPSKRYRTVDVGIVASGVTSAIVRLWWRGKPDTNGTAGWHTSTNADRGMQVTLDLSGNYETVSFPEPPGDTFTIQILTLNAGSLRATVQGEVA